jgi:hypothetical protein
MSEDEYFNYVKSIESFLNTEEITAFKPEALADTIAGLAGRNKRIRLTSAGIHNLKSIKNMIRIRNSIQAFGYSGTLKRIIRRSAAKK